MLHYQSSMAFFNWHDVIFVFLFSYCSLLLHAILIIPFFSAEKILNHCDDGAE